MIYNYELEKQLLAGLIKDPSSFIEVSDFIDTKDFYSENSSLHSTIFRVIQQAISSGDEVDEVIIAQRVNDVGLTFEDNLNPADYIKSLAMRKVPQGNVVKTAKELKKYSIRREIINSSSNIINKMKAMPPEATYRQIVESADNAYNAQINLYEIGNDSPVNIYEEMESMVEDRGANPITEFGMMGPHKKINEIYGSLLRPGNMTVIVARSGVGKMSTLSTKVLTPNGFTEMRNIYKGSKVTCPDGSTSTVTNIFDHKQKDIYRVHLNDGRYTDCGLEHLWKIWGRDNKGVYNWQIVDTAEIISHLKCPTKRVSLPLIEEVGVEQDLPLDPYCVGAFIGDGCLSNGPIIESADEEVINRMKLALDSEVSIKNDLRGSKSKAYRFLRKSEGYNGRENFVSLKLKEIGLYGKRSWEKHIPEIYLNASFDQKIALIQGMMDTDGTLNKAKGRDGERSFYGALSYSTCSEQLAKDFQKLIWSIGGIAKIKTKETFYKKDGVRINCRLSYRINIRFRNPKQLFYVSRKRDKAPDSDQYQYSDLKVRVDRVEKLPQKEDCRCIEIDHPDHLYVVDDYIVTHNTSLCMDYTTKVSLQYDVPVLHFDNGEMSKEELIMRQCSSLSGVPMHLLESGNWRKAGQDVVDKVRSVWEKIKKLRFYYFNVGGMDVDSMINALKRFYLSQVGRGNKMIFSFDYIKTTSQSQGNKNEWQIVGEMVDKFKRCIQKEILWEGEPIIPMITSVQSNRSGITNNRNSQNIIDDESVVSLSDRITQFCSHMFILRNKTTDEIESEGRRFGTHKLINVKSRHLGRDIAGAIEPVQMGDTLRRNFINLDFNNFSITERGDLRDIVRVANGDEDLTQEDNDNRNIPNFNQL